MSTKGGKLAVGLYVVLMVGLTGLTLFLASRASIDDQGYKVLARHIGNMEREMASVDVRLSQARLGWMPNYDGVIAAFKRAGSELDSIDQLSSANLARDYPDLRSRLNDLRSGLDTKENLVLDFLEANSVLNNSMNFFLFALPEFPQVAENLNEHEARLLNLGYEVMRFDLTRDRGRMPELRRLIAELVDIETRNEKWQKRVLASHADRILNSVLKVDENLDAALNMSLGRRIEATREQLTDQYVIRHQQAQVYQTLVFGCMAVLIFMLLGAIALQFTQHRSLQRQRTNAESLLDAVEQKLAATEKSLIEHNRKLMSVQDLFDQEQTRLKLLWDSSPDAYFRLDDKFRILNINESGLTCLRQGPEKWAGSDYFDLVHESDRDRVREQYQNMKGRFQDGEVECRMTPSGPDEVHYALQRVHPLKNEHGETEIWVSCRDVSTHQAIQEDQLEETRRQRDALVREVHHRIKNNLQGVYSLLQRHAQANPGAEDVFRDAMAQVEVIARIHGMHGQQSEGDLSLEETLRSIVGAAASVYDFPVSMSIDSGRLDGLTLRRTEAVPIALIFSELITNALKHSGGDDQPHARVAVEVRALDETVRVSIHNSPASLPLQFDFAGNLGLGTGLEIVKALMPARGARLAFLTTGDTVSAEMELLGPVIIEKDVKHGQRTHSGRG